jgi:shikimate kinase
MLSANARSIWLIGLMGSGKSTIGRALAQSLHYEYVDNDITIAALTGHSIVELAESGGTLLHDWESTYVHQVVANRRPLVAGIPASIADRCAELQLLRGSGTLVYLRCDLDTLVARVRTDGNRPWLKHDIRQTIEAMLADREPHLLRVAHLVLNSAAPVAEIVDRIVTGIHN